MMKCINLLCPIRPNCKRSKQKTTSELKFQFVLVGTNKNHIVCDGFESNKQ